MIANELAALFPFMLFFGMLVLCGLVFVGVMVHDWLTYEEPVADAHYWDHDSFFNVNGE